MTYTSLTFKLGMNFEWFEQSDTILSASRESHCVDHATLLDSQHSLWTYNQSLFSLATLSSFLSIEINPQVVVELSPTHTNYSCLNNL